MAERGAPSPQQPVEHRHLRGAIEYAVMMAEEISKRRRSFSSPKELKRYFGGTRIPSGALGRLRRAIDGDDAFRDAIAVGAVPDLVDPIGVLWLTRPDGWQERVAELAAAERSEQDDADLRAQLRREERRRVAAERAAVRQQSHVVDQQTTQRELEAELDALRADLVKATDALAEARAEVIDLRNEARHARDREAAAFARLESLRRPDATDDGATDRPDDGASPPVLPDQLAALEASSRASREVADRIDEFVAAHRTSPEAVADPQRSGGRRRVELPGGMIASSAEAAEFLVRTDAAVLVDGYNVSMLGWPRLDLADQRERLIDGLENLSRRFGTDVCVVFDGSSVVGAHSGRRREVRVVYSPDAVTADDVIRDEVARLPVSRPVVVVTNDAAIVRDVRAAGANTLPSNALLAVL